MSVKRTLKTRLYAEDLPLILETLENKGCEYRFNSRIRGFDRVFDLVVMVKGKYCVGFSSVRQRGGTFFQIYCDADYMSGGHLKRWKEDFEAQVKALQIKQQLSKNGYILTSYEENRERIVLRIKKAI